MICIVIMNVLNSLHYYKHLVLYSYKKKLISKSRNKGEKMENAIEILSIFYDAINEVESLSDYYDRSNNTLKSYQDEVNQDYALGKKIADNFRWFF